MHATASYTRDFGAITMSDVASVGGKNASLGELFNTLSSAGVGTMDGFASTAEAYRRLLAEGDLEMRLRAILNGLDTSNLADLEIRGLAARRAVLETPLPGDVSAAVLDAYDRLVQRLGREPGLAVRSSATAEDLPGASFAGQHETFLNVRGRDALLRAVHECYASLFTDRAISYRVEHGFDHMAVALSVGVQPMVRSDLASAGVIFTLDPESGFRNVVVVSGAWGLGEMVVQGSVTPDEWVVFKPTLENARPIVGRRCGTKEARMGYSPDASGTAVIPTTQEERTLFSLNDDEVLTLARWACRIEEHYSTLAGHPQPMDIEWAKDGESGALYIIQARPETVHSFRSAAAVVEAYRLAAAPPDPLATGQAVGEKIASGPARVIRDVHDLARVANGDVIIARITDPDWEPVMKRAAAIVTDEGGRTAHAAIVSRELGLPCLVGTGNATAAVTDGQMVTVSCAEGTEGHLYSGEVPFTVERLDASALPHTQTDVMLNVGDPARAFTYAALPNDGVGLARMEFIIANQIGIHPMALVRYPNLRDRDAVAEIARRIGGEEPAEYFIERLAEGIGRIAAAFYPKPVIVRMSDFKTNEYARLLGGAEFEPAEENPMLGFRGASRYYDPRYAEGFALECAAILRVRSVMGLYNVKVMIPFCRTVAEAKRVVAEMTARGLRQGESGLQIYAMCELPSNVMDAEAFLGVFDGYSIGSNDLTQLVLGIDRDSGTVAHLFDERDDAVRAMIAQAIAVARKLGKPIGICGQAPSDYPDFAAWLVEQGITSISLNPDAVIKTRRTVADAEGALAAVTEAGTLPGDQH
ncbi:MAG: phosphoenolpyruvate synthase [Bacteroidetes bacterium]|nr:phosphoenolpyruvate synthase [Bacteroidota bacterium]